MSLNNLNRFTKLITIFGPILFIIVFIILGFLDSNYNIFTQTVSELIYTKFGFFQILNFIILIISMLLFAKRFSSALKNKKLNQLIHIYYLMMGIGVIFLIIFPTDANNTHGLTLHNFFLYVVWIILLLSSFPTLKAVKEISSLNELVNFTKFIYFASIISLIGWTFFYDSYVISFAGIYQRISIIIACMGISVISYKLKT